MNETHSARIGEHIPSMPFQVHIRYGDAEGRVVKTQQQNFDDIGLATGRLNDALGWRNVVEVELVVVLKRVRSQNGAKRNWKSATPVVERRSLPEPMRGRSD